MVLFIVIAFKIGIGVGLYPIETFSIKYYYTNKNFIQMTIGIYQYVDTVLEEKNFACRVSIRGAQQLSYTHTEYYNYSHLCGVSVGLHFKKETFPLEGECFYEFDLLPNPKDVPISVAPEIIIDIKKRGISPLIGGGSHYYIK